MWSICVSLQKSDFVAESGRGKSSTSVKGAGSCTARDYGGLLSYRRKVGIPHPNCCRATSCSLFSPFATAEAEGELAQRG